MNVSSDQSYSFAIGRGTIGGFDWFYTFGPSYVGPKLSQLWKGTRYTVTVVCYNASYSQTATTPPDDVYSDGVHATAAAESGPPRNLVLSLLPQNVALSGLWTEPLDLGLGLLEPFEILYYSLECSTSSNFSQIAGISNVSGTQLTASLQGLTIGRSYFCRVRAVTAAGEGNYSQISGPQLLLGPPSQPVIMSSSSARDSNGMRLTVTWQLPVDTGDSTSSVVLVDQYQVQISNSSSFTYSFSETISPDPSLSANRQQQLISYNTGNSQSLTLMAAIQTWLGSFVFIRVRARTAQGLGNFSAIQSQIIGGSPGAPGQVVLAVSGPLSFNLSWSPPADKGIGPGRAYSLINYIIQLTNAQNLVANLIVDANMTSITIVDFQGSALVRGQKYTAAVQASNDLGTGPLSASQQSVAIGPSQAPANVILCPYNGGTSCSFGVTAFPDPPGALKLRYMP
jgi:hypothetical protein